MRLLELQTVFLYEMFNTTNTGSYSAYSDAVNALINPSYYLLFKIAIYAVCIAIVVVGIYLLISGSEKRAEVKNWVIRIFIAGVLIFCLLDVIAMVQNAAVVW